MSAQTQRIIEELLAGPQCDCPVTHEFTKGHYIRTVFFPAGALIVGHFHKYQNINVFVKGRLLLHMEDGTTQELCAPMTFIADPGSKTAYILEDVVWQNVYKTDVTTVDDFEKMYLQRNDYFIEMQAHKFALQSVQSKSDVEDFKKFLEETNLTEEIIQKEMESAGFIEYLPPNVKQTISPIHGDGIFATCNLDAHEIVGPVILGINKTSLGRFVNHSQNPNCEFADINGEYVLISKRAIAGAQGGLPGEELTVDYRQTINLTKERLCQQQLLVT